MPRLPQHQPWCKPRDQPWGTRPNSELSPTLHRSEEFTLCRAKRLYSSLGLNSQPEFPLKFPTISLQFTGSGARPEEAARQQRTLRPCAEFLGDAWAATSLLFISPHENEAAP